MYASAIQFLIPKQKQTTIGSPLSFLIEIAALLFNQSPTTTIMVAHRLSTIRNADRIYVFEGGKVVEVGTHEELMQRGGLYQDLFTKQTEGYQES